MIPQIKKILYTTDLSDNSAYVFRYAMNSAKRHDADIIILHVVEHIPSSAKALIDSYLSEQIENKIAKDIFVKADKLRLAELFKNIITNAVKYTPDGGGKITLDAKQDNNIVTVSITDTGRGMKKEQLKRIFDEFYRADKFVKLTDSIGLGLSICKRIVEKHGGKIWADSPGIGKGSTFYFTLKSSNEK